jgi:hypothetical protein
MTVMNRDELNKLEPMSKSEIGEITEVHYGTEDRGVLTVYLLIEGKWGSQAFGNIAINNRTGPSFVREVFGAFNPPDDSSPEQLLKMLMGRECTVYWKFNELHSLIEAIEGPRGIFVLNEWRQRMHPGTPSLVARRRNDLNDEVNIAQKRLREAEQRLAQFLREHPHD